MSQVEILEVAPRDGFQAVKPFIPTETKIALIEELAACGFKRLEIGSFVSPKAMPADRRHAGESSSARRLPEGLRVMALVPNAKGLELALEAGVKEISWVISVSESHNRANVNRSVDESFRAFAAAWDGLGSDRPKLRLASPPASTARGRGASPRTRSSACVERVIAPPPMWKSASATPRAAPRPTTSARCSAASCRATPATASRFAYHGHDTYGLGVANAIEAYRQGVRVIDGAAGGLGGCPFAPGAAGNTASEDLVFAFEHMGVKTGIDLGKLLTAADGVSRVAPEQAGGKLRIVPRKRALAGFGAATQGVGA